MRVNYLGHFVFNHRICGLPAEPYFALGVVLPDLWLRLSRTRRIRWRAVRAARPGDEVDAQLRAGLLNHVAVDRRFHGLPVFLRWQGAVRGAVPRDGTHPALLDFLAHLAVELALDHHLLREDPGLVAGFYRAVGGADAEVAAERVRRLGAVDTTGLAEVIRSFVARRFLARYATEAGLADVVRIVLELAGIPRPAPATVAGLLAAAAACVEPGDVWPALR